MKHFIEKYINPFTDYGFKKIFGEEPNKDLLLDFLNELLYEEQGRIVSLTYLKNEHLSSSELDRKAIFDLYCENEKGEKFIVELQKAKQNFFKDRALYYSTFPIREQAQKADWNYELKAVYTIAILDFVFDEDKENAEKFRYDIKLSDIETNKVFYDKLTFIYLEMPKFNKSVEGLETRFDKWLYVLRNLNRLDRVPEKLKERIFEKLFEVAEIAKFTPSQVYSYEDSLKYYRDLKNSLDTAKEEGFEEGKEQGREEEKLKIAKNLLENNVSKEVVMKTTGLTQEQIEHLEF
ncbi:Rpn family recombination-promoting nuclease/putative transposase [Ornithobacterium rhinotracheale]|uniref:Rpn family recombination-promoting nuclease/putative transposase n=1 Tax=Ornithobacterium rhinotracheale TaxID=28251 RepID=UPI00129C8CC2|nr:Rpn family recombination-promoting nuclease/putative transposase [Ornithobacterium rhinotracheale]MRJ09280.1 Rpn family recombination-promoting nuclease/putative transposase [Ornithobacterium rhinotracheale]UOH77797.1 Rpn family recombination-promoting nuclease/putative transposase [Ornithobacterium rhinotracheale]